MFYGNWMRNRSSRSLQLWLITTATCMSLPKTVCCVWQTVVVRASIILFSVHFAPEASRQGSMEGNLHKTRWANLSLLPALTIAVAKPKRSR
jgi:hypothetical protein